jgi:hypothetical protein
MPSKDTQLILQLDFVDLSASFGESGRSFVVELHQDEGGRMDAAQRLGTSIS